jgi:ABC-type lipoprotein export system ATPase subunit
MGRGEFVAVMGPSGCGKSTLLNLVAGLDSADDGEIVIVFQFFNLLEGMSVLENVALPAIVAGMKRKAAETRARDLLDLLGLSEKAKAAPGVLSGGQRQRLAIARALANKTHPGAGRRAHRGAGLRGRPRGQEARPTSPRACRPSSPSSSGMRLPPP